MMGDRITGKQPRSWLCDVTLAYPADPICSTDTRGTLWMLACIRSVVVKSSVGT